MYEAEAMFRRGGLELFHNGMNQIIPGSSQEVEQLALLTDRPKVRRQSGLFEAVISKINDCGSDVVLLKQNEGQEGLF